MTIKTLTIAAFAATAVLAAPVSASTMNLLENGSFETDAEATGLRGNDFADLAGSTGGNSWDIFETLPGWYSDFGDGIEIQTAGTLGKIDPQDGDHYVELDSNNNSSALQDVVLAAGDYVMSFWFAPRTGDSASNGIDFGVGIGGELDDTGFTIFTDLLTAGSVTGPSDLYPQNEWTLVTAEFTVEEAGLVTLFFDAVGESDSLGGLIDNVSIAAVPLPAGMLLLLTGMGGLAAMRRRSAK